MAETQEDLSDQDSANDLSDEFDDVFYGPGFVMARKGRFIFTESTLSKDEHRELLETFASYREGLDESIERQVQELEEILSELNPLDVIGNIALINSILDPETYKEYSHKGSDIYTEYISLLCLTKPREAYPRESEEPILGPVLEEIQERAEDLLRDTVMYYAFKDIDPDRPEPPDALTRLRFSILSRSFLVRYMTYHHHKVDVLRGIFGPLEDELRTALGFSIEDALVQVYGIESLVNQRLVERREESRGFEKWARKAIKRYRQKKREDSEIPLDILTELASMRPSGSAEVIRNWAIGRMFFRLGDALSFSSADLARETGISEERIEAFLKRMSLKFGGVESRYRVPAPTHPLMERPLVQDGERYFCPVLNLALWSLRPAIEAFIKPGSADAVEEGEVLWERYNRSRADYVEEKAVQYLAETLRHAEVYRNLTYQVSENGETKEVELDGLLMIDSALFLVEAKAGTLSPPARRGAPKRIYREIKELVEDAYLQALRAKRYIEQTDSASFSLADGTVVEVARERFDRIFLVTVTLEPMDAFVTMIYQLQDLGLFSEGDLPWAVCLTDLRVISEVIEFPSQLIHYLTRRHRLNELGRIETHDELDWLGHYLCEGLYFEDILADQDESSVVRLLSYTTDLDNYYLYTTGQRKTPAPKPTQPMPEVMRHILTELEAHHPDGYLDAACLLLDMGSDSREAFVEHVIRQRELALQEEDSRDFSMVFSEERFGLTYMFAPSIQVSNLKSRLPAYCQMKKYQTKSNLWVGLGCIVDAPGWAQAGFVFKSPWAFDEEMDKLVTESLPPLPRDQHGDS